ncbi:MAG: choice-of-anchor B domain-containing protein [Pseudohongiellaceae bacterium]|jgi:choice-of-anchor B domain-containing protein
MLRLSPVSRFVLLLTAALTLTPTLTAHDSVEFMSQRQAPFAAPLVLYKSNAAEAPFTSNGVTLLSWLPLSAFAGSQTRGADCWGYVSPSGREYAIIGMSAGVSFVEITDPGLPVVIQTFAAVPSSWRDVKIYEDFAYYVSEGGDGVQIVDMSQIDSGIVTNVGSVNSAGTTASHNVAINEDSGFLYQIGGGSSPEEGLRIYSLANKANPVFVAEWDDRYIHDAQIVNYTSGPFAGREIAFCFSETSSGGGSPGVDILDVTNKGNIQSLSLLTYTNPVFSHQGWLSPDKQYLYINDELDETSFGTNTTTRVIDVSNLNAPFQVSTFSTGLDAVDHNLYTKGNLIYEANYRSGLRVFDASNPTSPVETAFFDTYDPDDAAAFNGLWNVFPYFDSDTIIGSDIEKGLFVWRLGSPELSFAVAGQSDLINPNGEQLDVTITAAPGSTVQAGSPTFHLDTGSGFSTMPMTSLGGGVYRASFPALACETEVTYYFTARTNEGVTWSEPSGAPTALYGATAATSVTIEFSETLETNPGWTVGAPGDTATTGIWTRVDPIGTGAQTEDDHTPGPGSDCYVTGQGFLGGSLGDDDVDGGETTLRTSTFDASGGDCVIRYWRWYSNSAGSGPGEDVFVVDISNNNGSSWTNVEVVGPTGPETLGGWFQHSFKVSDLLTPTSQMRLRFVASDLINGSIVEAAVDDLEVVLFDCSEVCQLDLGFGGPGNSIFSICGESLDSGNSATLSLTQAPANTLSVLFLSLASNPQPFKGGMLATLPILLDLSLQTDGSGSITLPIAGGNGPLTIYGQFAIVDGAQPFGVGLSNALEIEFGP